MVQRLSRFIRNWNLRCVEIGRSVNSSLIAIGTCSNMQFYGGF
jgi:hypothetical protein